MVNLRQSPGATHIVTIRGEMAALKNPYTFFDISVHVQPGVTEETSIKLKPFFFVG